MKSEILQLQPPQIPLDADIRWVLTAAFADRYPPAARPASAQRAAQLVQQFTLVNSITSRLSQEQLVTALSPALQEQLSQIARHRVMRSLAVVQAREQVTKAAVNASVDIVLLKQAALEALGLVSQGQRYATDVDILLEPDSVPSFSETLKRLGFVPEKDKTHAHGAVVLRTADNIGIELHTLLVDLRLPNDPFSVDFNRLKERGLIGQLDKAGRHVWTPCAEVLGAQFVAQGWYLFHFVPNAPLHKSPWRIIVNMGLIGLHRDRSLADRVYEMVQHSLPIEEYSALIELVNHLARGDLENLPQGARQMANHAIAALLDETYRRSLILPRQRHAILSEGLLQWTRRNLVRALLPSRQQIEAQLRQSGVTTELGARWRISKAMALNAIRGLGASLRRSRR